MAHKWPSCRIPKDLLMAEVLECFELQPDNSVFLELIPIFPKSHASQILGFKFQYYQHMEVSCPVPFGLYKLTALLFFDGYEYHETSFGQTYQCYPASFLEKNALSLISWDLEIMLRRYVY
ncbi:uncharacterized protein LOC107618983 isoform X6 [Arachis ipaensis]|uniref:uncharacterized protein LOC107618983 isoform X6 n=1 Tax=Arachis ipaensis TaxID=130454 RepID=UPI000A2B03AF|nr:uncharacterized protein LOC107618983 isoform X6 [Arachis ipaensis]XP_025679914.1 uncharacterized protein LOC112779784 isoform X2 [Arachis hypogaea]XP_025679915.1 uncharacterized protein LOC112779784 isoform X2 [Arachis hypogaea]